MLQPCHLGCFFYSESLSGTRKQFESLTLPQTSRGARGPQKLTAAFRFEYEQHLQARLGAAAQIHGAEIDPGRHFAGFIADILPDVRCVLVIEDVRGPAV